VGDFSARIPLILSIMAVLYVAKLCARMFTAQIYTKYGGSVKPFGVIF
jgi:hypothetical protein